MEMLRAKKDWQKIFQVMKNKGLKPRLLYPARLSITMESKIRDFPDKRRLKESHLHQTSTARYAKGTALRRGRKRVRERGTQI